MTLVFFRLMVRPKARHALEKISIINYMSSSVHTYIRTYVRTYIHTNIHNGVKSAQLFYIHVYIRTYIPT